MSKAGDKLREAKRIELGLEGVVTLSERQLTVIYGSSGPNSLKIKSFIKHMNIRCKHHYYNVVETKLSPPRYTIFPISNRQPTYFQIDTALMFRYLTHASVLEVVDALTEAKGLRALSELDRKPILKDLF